ncbi:MAG: hypothetical protein Q8882_08270 [Bacillota bacterium]|nr:hypothetical protein [Bacillota bacterium]
MKIPVIKSEWKKLFGPERFGDYVNDHTIIKDNNGIWHLIGITSFEGVPSMERYFVHARGENLSEPMAEWTKNIDTGALAWAPCVIEHRNAYYMYYGPSPTKMAVSIDLNEWMGYEIRLNGNPPMSCHRDHFVLRISENQWLMYVVGIRDGKGCVSCLESSDLLSWDFSGYALTLGDDAVLMPPWGAIESPYVVFMDDLYYLFVTYTDCSKDTYNNTLVFCSDNPKSFGEYNSGESGALPVATLSAHAPEIIKDEKGWHITTCGWKSAPVPIPGCVSIADLEWIEK